MSALRLLDGAPEAYPAMMGAIASARRSVLLEIYRLDAAGIGADFLDALADARRRGARVEVRVDGWGSAVTAPALAERLEAAGCELRVYNRLRDTLWGRFDRNHRKILVVDERVGFVGGLNLADEYLGGPQGAPWADVAVRVEARGCAALTRAVRREHGRATIDRDVDVWLSGRGGGWRLLRRYRRAFEDASRRIWLAHAYFLPDRRLVRRLVRAARRGVDVRLLMPARSDVPLATHAIRGLYPRLQRAGVRIFEWERSVLHAKLALVDDRTTLVGSFNLDPLSFMNRECLLDAASRSLAGQAGAWLEARFDDAREVPESSGSWFDRRIRAPLGLRLRDVTWRAARALAAG